MKFESRMRCLFFISTAVIFLSVSVASASLVGTFRLVDAEQTTIALIYPGQFDTWEFDVENIGLRNVDALEMHFQGNFLNTTGNTVFQQRAGNHVPFGWEAPETFFVTRPTIAPADVLIAPGTLIDTTTEFKVSYTVAGTPSLLNAGEERAVAFFSVPSGEMLGRVNFVSGRAAIDGELVEIRYVPEPTGAVLSGWAIFGVACRRFRNRGVLAIGLTRLMKKEAFL